MKKTMVALALSTLFSASANANVLSPNTNYVMDILSGGMDFGDASKCPPGSKCAVTNNGTNITPAGSSVTYGSSNADDGVPGRILFTTGDMKGDGSIDFTVTEFSVDAYPQTSGGAFATFWDATVGPMSGTVMDDGNMTLDMNGRKGIAQFFDTSLGVQVWNVDKGTGAYEPFTTGESCQGAPGVLCLTGSPLADDGTGVLLGTLVSAGNVGSAWGFFDGTPYSELYDISVTAVPSAIPIPAAVWLFGSGIIGLIGIARNKKQVAM